MALTGMSMEEAAFALGYMEAMGLLVNDAQITLYLRHGVQDTSRGRLPEPRPPTPA